MAGVKSLDDLFLTTLKDVYYAERQAQKALPKMAKAAHTPELRDAFMLHKDQTAGQVERLKQVFQAIGKRPQGVTCEAMNGLNAEFEELLEEAKEPSAVRDAGIIACAQAIEHYEIARYGAMLAWAKATGKTEVVELLKATLDEEKQTDAQLNKMANGQVNKAAAKEAA
ncbi:ferritin-like domain-containing protein [Pararoseomonas indoligenes]|uniref:Ferritin-like domain-containing protein n=1 Tax=Roseomonas indoligenes TaxID=2820811 RepID=A0A940S5D0_9PROT|nr:ferritin-like domain-containing protein [Pararoseomonas indoligenes]MBP0492899.1 ferritin-like domain-containing protein [Pararoseomonas indoligenes]